MSLFSIRYLIGFAWQSPALAMMQNTYPKEKQGSMVTSWYFYMTMSGTLSTAICGYVAGAFQASVYPQVYGWILAVALTLSCATSIPFFYKAEKAYKNHI